jgi:hypothetical protein
MTDCPRLMLPTHRLCPPSVQQHSSCSRETAKGGSVLLTPQVGGQCSLAMVRSDDRVQDQLLCSKEAGPGALLLAAELDLQLCRA